MLTGQLRIIRFAVHDLCALRTRKITGRRRIIVDADKQIRIAFVSELHSLIQRRIGIRRPCVIHTDILIIRIKHCLQFQKNRKVNIFLGDAKF